MNIENFTYYGNIIENIEEVQVSSLGFYDEYLKLMGNLKDKPDLATPYKIEYLKNIIRDGKVYKFISFEENADIKINTLLDGKIWFSFYKILNDETEFEIDYKVKKVVGKTGYKKEYIDLIVNYLTEMYDVYSLTYMYQEYMWEDYAANGNGICVEFEVGDYDYLYPVEYCDKSKIDFTRMVVSALKQSGMELSIIPWVVKNPYNQTSDMDSTREKEVRMLYCPYDLAEFNGGTIAYNIKERKDYKGIAKPYEDFKLKIVKVIIGDKCREEYVSELQNHFDVQGINYTMRKKE